MQFLHLDLDPATQISVDPWGGLLLLEGSSQLINDFIEASRNFILKFLHKKTAKKIKMYKPSSLIH